MTPARAGVGEESGLPQGPVPARYRDLLASRAVGHLATIGPDGRPQVNPVWFVSDGERLFLSVKADTQKLRNMRAHPAVAMSVTDLADPGRYVEVRGEVSDLQLYDTLEWVNVLARKYTGRDFAGGRAGEHRYKVTVRIGSWTGQG